MGKPSSAVIPALLSADCLRQQPPCKVLELEQGEQERRVRLVLA